MDFTNDIENTIKTDYRNGELGLCDTKEEDWIKDAKVKMFLDILEAKQKLKEAELIIKKYNKKYGKQMSNMRRRKI